MGHFSRCSLVLGPKFTFSYLFFTKIRPDGGKEGGKLQTEAAKVNLNFEVRWSRQPDQRQLTLAATIF